MKFNFISLAFHLKNMISNNLVIHYVYNNLYYFHFGEPLIKSYLYYLYFFKSNSLNVLRYILLIYDYLLLFNGLC
jgi:hypothetical protein